MNDGLENELKQWKLLTDVHLLSPISLHWTKQVKQNADMLFIQTIYDINVQISK